MSRQDALMALVDHWRTVAAKVVDSGYATATRLCADELERALLSGGGDDDRHPMRGRMATADFEDGTLTFQMIGDYYAAAGEYVITYACRPAMSTTPEASK